MRKYLLIQAIGERIAQSGLPDAGSLQRLWLSDNPIDADTCERLTDWLWQQTEFDADDEPCGETLLLEEMIDCVHERADIFGE